MSRFLVYLSSKKILNFLGIICVLLQLFIISSADANECLNYLNQKNSVPSVFDAKFSRHINPAATVMVFIDRFNHGKNIKIEELIFILDQLLERSVLTTYEANTGLEIANGFFESYGMREEKIYKGVVTFSLRLFDLQNKDYIAHLKRAHVFALEYIKQYPESNSAHTILAEVNKRIKIQDSIKPPMT